MNLLVWQAIRRDRVLAPVWILVLAATCYVSAAATGSLYPTTADQLKAAEGINASPAIVALYGPILDVNSLGELAMTKMTVLYALFLALMCIVLVRRHTRVEEEAGRAELVGAGAVGRLAPLAAAIVVGGAAAVAAGVLAAGANIVGGLPPAGSIVFGASWIGIGWVSVGIAAVACQLSPSSRTCAEISAVSVGILYVLRAIGDASSHTWLSWLSPFGWSTQLSAWSHPRLWVLLLFLILATALIAGAFWLRQRRDIGAGLFAARPGPASGTPRLRDALSLTLRLNAPSLLAWTIAAALLAGLFGGIVPQVGDLLDSPSAREALERLGGAGTLENTVLEDTVFAAVISILAVVLTAFGVATINHSAADERDGRTALVLATSVSRRATFFATVAIALGGTVFLLFVTSAALTLGFAVSGGSTSGNLIGATLAQAPAVWLVVAMTLLAWTMRNAWAAAGWILLTVFVSLGQFGELLKLPIWVTDLSPYSHVALMPVQSFDPVNAAVLTSVAAALIGLSFWCYQRRDIG